MNENLRTELQAISTQAQKDRASREQQALQERKSAEEARLSGRMEEIRSLARKQAEEGETWLVVSRLDFNTYGYKFWTVGKRNVTPDDLKGEERALGKLLAGDGFTLNIGFECPDGAGDPPPGSVYNYFYISWNNDS